MMDEYILLTIGGRQLNEMMYGKVYVVGTK